MNNGDKQQRQESSYDTVAPRCNRRTCCGRWLTTLLLYRRLSSWLPKLDQQSQSKQDTMITSFSTRTATWRGESFHDSLRRSHAENWPDRKANTSNLNKSLAQPSDSVTTEREDTWPEHGESVPVGMHAALRQHQHSHARRSDFAKYIWFGSPAIHSAGGHLERICARWYVRRMMPTSTQSHETTRRRNDRKR